LITYKNCKIAQAYFSNFIITFQLKNVDKTAQKAFIVQGFSRFKGYLRPPEKTTEKSA
jgi:hypothetical protein